MHNRLTSSDDHWPGFSAQWSAKRIHLNIYCHILLYKTEWPWVWRSLLFTHRHESCLQAKSSWRPVRQLAVDLFWCEDVLSCLFNVLCCIDKLTVTSHHQSDSVYRVNSSCFLLAFGPAGKSGFILLFYEIKHTFELNEMRPLWQHCAEANLTYTTQGFPSRGCSTNRVIPSIQFEKATANRESPTFNPPMV